MNRPAESMLGSIRNVSKLVLPMLFVAALTLFLLISGSATHAATVLVNVQEDIPHFDPLNVTIHPGDTVQWIWVDRRNHSVVSGNGSTGTPDGLFSSGIHTYPFTYSVTFPNLGTFPYYCGVHRRLNTSNTWPSIQVVAPTAASGVLSNISTRLRVGTDSDVLIGGFIIGGSGPKQLLFRALGPTLTQFGVTGALENSTLELRNSTGGLITFNDNWGEASNAQSIPSNLRPPNSLESAILTSLNPGSYTAIVRGKNNTTGVALVEAYDLDTNASSHLTNISTRGLVETLPNLMIAGMIVDSNSEKVIVRALGPTLANFGITNSLANPILELHDANGALLASNDNWKSTQQSEISASGHVPPNDLESAIVRTLTPGNYTAIVRGVNNTTGVALVEVYTLQ